MGYVGTKPTAAPLTSSQLEDGLVTAAKLATDAVETAKVKDLNVTVAKLPAAVDISTKTVTLPASVSGLGTGIDVTSQITGTVPTANLGSGSASASTYLAGNQTYQTITEYDDSVLQSNIAMLGFKVAVNGSLTRYNLVDQSIDEFYDTSGVDASASTNEQRVASGSNFYYTGASGTNPSGGNSTDSSVTGYTTLVFTSSGALTIVDGGDVDVLVVAGAGSGGNSYGGGGGAGGLVYKTGHAVTTNTYDMVIGDGGAAQTSAASVGNVGVDSTWTINGGAVEFTAKGGGFGAQQNDAAGAGGSGGGSGHNVDNAGSSTQGAQAGDSGTYGFGYAGGEGTAAPNYNGGGGGGAGSVGGAGNGSSGNGGTGKDLSAIFGTAVGDSGWFASGGGAAFSNDGADGVGTVSAGGGGRGALDGSSAGTAGTANTGGGGGGGSGSGAGTGAGGKGVVLVRYANDEFQTILDLTLQSTDVTAVAEPDFGEFVTLIENAAGTATLNTDIKGYVSRDSGANFTQGTLVDEGTWGTNKKVLGFHDLDISSQPSGTSMCYKITTHNQSASKETRVYATSIGWR